MEQIKIPMTVLMLAERHGFVVMEKGELENHLAITSVVLGAAVRMYDALEAITKLGPADTKAAAIAIAKDTQADVDRRLWREEPPEH